MPPGPTRVPGHVEESGSVAEPKVRTAPQKLLGAAGCFSNMKVRKG